jgi:hypothetical protein
MSNQPSPGPRPPDASEEMPLELFRPHPHCTDAACHFRDFSAFLMAESRSWSFPPFVWFDRACVLSARRYLKDLLVVSLIKQAGWPNGKALDYDSARINPIIPSCSYQEIAGSIPASVTVSFYRSGNITMLSVILLAIFH